MTPNITITGQTGLNTKISVETSDWFSLNKLRAKEGKFHEPDMPQRVVGHYVVEEPLYSTGMVHKYFLFHKKPRIKEIELHEIGSVPDTLSDLEALSKYTQNLPQFFGIHEKTKPYYDPFNTDRRIPITAPDVDSHEGLVAVAQRLAARQGFFAGLEELLHDARASLAFRAPEKPEKSDVEEAQRGFRRELRQFVQEFPQSELSTLIYGHWVHYAPSMFQYGFAASLAKEGLTGITPEDIPTTKKSLSWFNAGLTGQLPVLQSDAYSLQERMVKNGLTLWGNKNGVNYVSLSEEDFPVNEEEQSYFSRGKQGLLFKIPNSRTEREDKLYRLGLELWAGSHGYGVEDVGLRAERISHPVDLQRFKYQHREKLGGLRR